VEAGSKEPVSTELVGTNDVPGKTREEKEIIAGEVMEALLGASVVRL